MSRRAAGMVLAALVACGGGERAGRAGPIPGTDGQRVTVEVLNGTRVDGLARRMTAHLRRHGLDVVYFGSAESLTDTTRILWRRDDSTGAVRVRAALGTGRVEEARDPRLLLDVTVILGADAALLDGRP